MTRNSLLAGCFIFSCVACGHTGKDANSADPTMVNPSADSGTIEQMTDNDNSPDSVDGGKINSGNGGAAAH